MDEGSVLALFALGAVAQRVTQEAAHESRVRGEQSLSELTWLIRDHTPVTMVLAQEDLDTGNAARMIRIFTPDRTPVATQSVLWGRLFLQVPDDPEGKTLLPMIPNVRRLFRAVQRDLAMFPLYLDPRGGGLFDWFGSLAPPEALTQQGVNLLHPAVLSTIAASERSMYECGKTIGQNPWLAVQSLFDPVNQAREQSQA